MNNGACQGNPVGAQNRDDTSQIMNFMADSRVVVNTIFSELDQLGERISPVMIPAFPVGCLKEITDGDVLAPAAEEFKDLYKNLISVRDRIQTMRERVRV